MQNLKLPYEPSTCVCVQCVCPPAYPPPYPSLSHPQPPAPPPFLSLSVSLSLSGTCVQQTMPRVCCLSAAPPWGWLAAASTLVPTPGPTWAAPLGQAATATMNTCSRWVGGGGGEGEKGMLGGGAVGVGEVCGGCQGSDSYHEYFCSKCVGGCVCGCWAGGGGGGGLLVLAASAHMSTGEGGGLGWWGEGAQLIPLLT